MRACFLCALPCRLFNAAIGFLLLSGMTQLNLLLRGDRKIAPMVYFGFAGIVAACYMRYKVGAARERERQERVRVFVRWHLMDS